MQMSALFDAFFKNLWCVCTDKGGWASAAILQIRAIPGGGLIFHDFVRTSFMDGP